MNIVLQHSNRLLSGAGARTLFCALVFLFGMNTSTQAQSTLSVNTLGESPTCTVQHHGNESGTYYSILKSDVDHGISDAGGNWVEDNTAMPTPSRGWLFAFGLIGFRGLKQLLRVINCSILYDKYIFVTPFVPRF